MAWTKELWNEFCEKIVELNRINLKLQEIMILAKVPAKLDVPDIAKPELWSKTGSKGKITPEIITRIERDAAYGKGKGLPNSEMRLDKLRDYPTEWTKPYTGKQKEQPKLEIIEFDEIEDEPVVPDKKITKPQPKPEVKVDAKDPAERKRLDEFNKRF